MDTVKVAPRALVVLAFVTVCVVWGSTYLAIRVALVDYPPFLVAAVRFLAAGSLLAAWARLRGQRWPTAAEWRAGAVQGVLFFVIGNGLLCAAERSVSSSLAAVLVATMPLWATVYSRLLGDAVSRREMFGVTLGLGGVAVMNLGGELRSSGHGALLALLAPMGWGLGSVLSRRLPLPKGAMGLASQMLPGGVGVLLVGLATGERFPTSPRAASTLAIAYLAVMGSLVGFTAFTYLLQHTRAAVATSYAYVNPLVAILLGVALAGERLDPASAVGGLIVLGSVLLVLRGRRTRPAAAAQTSGDASRSDASAPALRVASQR